MWIKRLLGLERRRVPPHVFCMDTEDLCYARLIERDTRFEVEAFEGVELPSDLMTPGPLGGPLREVAPLRELVASLLEKEEGVTQASLVLPDSWLRVVFTEAEQGSRLTDTEELRWMLRKLVPFRVEDLRLVGVETAPLGKNRSRRLMLAFAIEQLLAQIEEAFEANGVELGQVTSAGSAALDALAGPLGAIALGGYALLARDGYSLVFTQGGEPAIHRFKAVGPADTDATSLGRDLRLTRSYVREQVSQAPLGRFLIVGPAQAAALWAELIAEVFEVATLVVDEEVLRVNNETYGLELSTLAPMLGAAQRELM